MRRLRIKSIKQMFSIFLWVTLLVVAICAIFTFALLYKNITNAKKSAIDSVFYSTDSIISEHIEAINAAETILHLDRDVQEYLNTLNSDISQTLKVNAADKIQNTVDVKGRGLGAALFADNNDGVILACNADIQEQEELNNFYQRYKNSSDEELFIYDMDNPLYPELYICHFAPVIYHSLQTVESYEIGTMAVFAKINIYQLQNNVKKNSLMKVELINNKTDDFVVLVDTSDEKGGTKQTKRIDNTNWYVSVELFEIIGASFLSPFVVLSIILLMILLLYVLLLRKSIRVLVDTPVKQLSAYLEDFVLSQSKRTTLETVGIAEFDDILVYINELFRRVTTQAHFVMQTQQEMYEKELLASEQTLYMNQLQINPHFLFNTLNTITQMCLAKGLNDVTVITHSISEIFRYSTEGEFKATVDEEIYIVLKYLKIFNSRYGREFECELDIEDELYEFEVMKMTLQPLIENSFKHGSIANVDKPVIKISAHREGEYIVISVFDNGNGIPADKLEILNHDLRAGNTKKNRGIGLLNVNKRLKICYGHESGLEIDSKYGEYTKIIIRIKDEKQG